MKRTIIITGGTTGIGKATAYQFAKNGWNVVITSRPSNAEARIKEPATISKIRDSFFICFLLICIIPNIIWSHQF